MIPESKFCRYCNEPIIIAEVKRCKICKTDLSIIRFSHWKQSIDHRRHKCRRCDNAYNRRRAQRKVIDRSRLLLILIGRGFWEPEILREQAGLKPQQFEIYTRRLIDKGRIVKRNGHFELNGNRKAG